MDKLAAFICGAVVIEGLVSYADMIVTDKKINWKVIGAILLGCLIAFNLRLDFFQILGFEEVNAIVGTILTGILISRGSNYVYELYDKFTNWRKAPEK